MLSDTQLIKRARYGGRNLTGLAILATLLSVVMTLGMLTPARDLIMWFAAALSVLAAAYWALAVAARHGDQRAITIVMAFLSVQLLIGSIGFVFAFRASGTINANILQIIIPIAIVAALYRNRADLLELKRRGLWDSQFGALGSQSRLCLAGGVLMLAGIIALYASLIIPAVQAVQTNRLRDDFIALISSDEKKFLTELVAAAPLQSPQAAATFLKQADELRSEARKLADRAPSGSELRASLQKYVAATDKWCAGLTILKEGGSRQRAQAEMEQGDSLRLEAFTEFDKQVGPAKQR